jgi:glutathione synthase
MRFLFVMDPAEQMLFDRDTSLALMRAALVRGHTTLHCLPNQVGHCGDNLFARARPISVSDAEPPVTLGEAETVELAAIDAVFVRKNPPFDLEYLHLTQQLDLLKDRTLVINDPRGLRDANEKLFAFYFAHYMPRSLVSADRIRILDFVAELGGRAVLKPLDGAGGSGVVALRLDDRNKHALIELLTADGSRLALVQEYLGEIRSGDKRVLMLDGEPLGAILRVPQADELRANIHVGGRVEPTSLTPPELELVRAVGRRLREHGLWFVGLDLIGGRLIEVNVTSPTGIQELGRLNGTQPERQVVAWVEQAVATLGSE